MTSPRPSDELTMATASTPKTIAQLPFFTTGRFPKPTLIGQCRQGQVIYTSGRDLLPIVRDLSLGLQSLGLSRGDRVAIVSESRPEWLFVDFAVLTAGAVTAPIYPTLSAEQVAEILADSGATIAVVSSAAQLEKVLAAARRAAPRLSVVVVIDPAEPTDVPTGVTIRTMAEVSAAGHAAIQSGWGVARDFQQAAERVSPDDLATIIYTSGTTGTPKGVMLTHANLVSNLAGVLERLDLSDEDVALSFLPLCHALERIVSYVYMMTGISMIFAESFDTIARDLLVVRPTVMSAVPRVFEKLKARIDEKVAAASPMRQHIFRWASGVAVRRGARLSSGRALTPGLRVSSHLADRLAFQKIRDGVGGRLRYTVSGSAPLEPTLARFFLGVGLPILEGYGLTETAPVLTVMPLGAIRFGTVGPPLSNVDVRIAEDGEILARGPNVMRGYYNRPAETADVLRDGWFHTGDLGAFDADGYLKITDRKKDVLVTSGGKKVAPQPIEQQLRADPLVSEAILVGDRRHFIAALVVPDLGMLAASLGIAVEAVRARLESHEVRARYQAVVDRVNQPLAQFERIKRFALVTEEVSMASGLLTPSLKIKRRVVDERFRPVIDELYL